MKKVGHNMFVDGNKFYSFLTHVATIDGNKLIELGKYSRTTSKHVKKFAEMNGLELVPAKNKVNEFDELWHGVNLKVEHLKQVN
jgi:hypothetical protein